MVIALSSKVLPLLPTDTNGNKGETSDPGFSSYGHLCVINYRSYRHFSWSGHLCVIKYTSYRHFSWSVQNQPCFSVQGINTSWWSHVRVSGRTAVTEMKPDLQDWNSGVFGFLRERPWLQTLKPSSLENVLAFPSEEIIILDV